jgi:hypothetical protein
MRLRLSKRGHPSAGIDPVPLSRSFVVPDRPHEHRPRTAHASAAHPRRTPQTRQIKVGKVLVGGDAPVSVQSMTTTLTANINATLQQIAELTATGCDIVRVAVPSQDDADALPAIARSRRSR